MEKKAFPNNEEHVEKSHLCMYVIESEINRKAKMEWNQ